MIPHSKVILQITLLSLRKTLRFWTEKETQYKDEQESSERDKSVITKFFINFSHTQ